MGVPLLQVIHAEPDDPRLHETRFTQPALFALEYSLAHMWQSWGVEPAALLGHSVGEYVAACLAGVFDLEDGLRLITERARLMQELPRNGSMAAVFADEETVGDALRGLEDRVSIAAVNGPRNVVISGDSETVNEVRETLTGQKIRSKPLQVSHAFHSPLMEPMLDEFAAVAAQIRFQSAAEEALHQSDGSTSHRRADHLVPSIGAIMSGRRSALRTPWPSCDPRAFSCFSKWVREPRSCRWGGPRLRAVSVPGYRHCGKVTADWRRVLETLGELYTGGLDVDWDGFYRASGRREWIYPPIPSSVADTGSPIKTLAFRGGGPRHRCSTTSATATPRVCCVASAAVCPRKRNRRHPGCSTPWYGLIGEKWRPK